jgi:hypothetical protein
VLDTCAAWYFFLINNPAVWHKRAALHSCRSILMLLETPAQYLCFFILLLSIHCSSMLLLLDVPAAWFYCFSMLMLLSSHAVWYYCCSIPILLNTPAAKYSCIWYSCCLGFRYSIILLLHIATAPWYASSLIFLLYDIPDACCSLILLLLSTPALGKGTQIFFQEAL